MPAQRRRQLLRAWLPALLYMATIWLLSSASYPVSLESVPFRDKGIHYLEYLGLATLLARAFHLSNQTWGRARVALSAFALASLWGYLDELHQAFVPGRDSSIFDVAADMLGALTGVALYLLFVQLFRRTSDR